MAAGLGGSTSIAVSHGAGGSREGSAERAESGRLGEGSAKHDGRGGEGLWMDGMDWLRCSGYWSR